MTKIKLKKSKLNQLVQQSIVENIQVMKELIKQVIKESKQEEASISQPKKVTPKPKTQVKPKEEPKKETKKPQSKTEKYTLRWQQTDKKGNVINKQKQFSLEQKMLAYKKQLKAKQNFKKFVKKQEVVQNKK